MNRKKSVFARIKFATKNGGIVKWINEKKILEELGLIADISNSNATYINIGDNVKIDGQYFTIKEIRTKFFPKTYGEEDNYDNYVSNEQLPCNFQITYIVE